MVAGSTGEVRSVCFPVGGTGSQCGRCRSSSSKRQQALKNCGFLDITPEAVELAGRFIEQKAIPKQAVEDALHVAVATVSGMDYLLTWNFKHIANAAMRANVELVCRLNGYEPPVICSPMELMEV